MNGGNSADIFPTDFARWVLSSFGGPQCQIWWKDGRQNWLHYLSLYLQEWCLDILEQMDGWIPSTFEECHQGPSWTWTHPPGNKSRLDYIIVENNNMIRECKSWTDLEFQCSLTVRDHEVAANELDLVLCTTSKRWRNQQYDWEALHAPEGPREFRRIVRNLPDIPWEVDVHSHWQRLQDGIHAGLAASFPMKKARKKQGIFTADTWKSLDMRKRAKRLLDSCDVHLLHLDRKASFRPWKDGTDITSSGRLQFLDKMALVLCHLHGLPFRLASKEVRAKVKSDKARFVDSVVDKAEAAQGIDLYKELRPLRIGSRSKKGNAALPGLALDGEQARDHIHNETPRPRHCAEMIAGVVTSTARLLQRARRSAAERHEQLRHPFSLDSAPTLSMLEGAFRHIKRSKAGGLDGFKSDICVAAPKEMASKFFPIMVKTLASLEEPIQMKGGLVELRTLTDTRHFLQHSHWGAHFMPCVYSLLPPIAGGARQEFSSWTLKQLIIASSGNWL